MLEARSATRMAPKVIVCEFTGTEDEVNAYEVAKMHPLFTNAESFRDQIGLLCTYLRNEQVHVSFERIARLFPNTTKQSVQKQYIKFNKLPQKVGRPEKLDDEDIRKISDEITKLHNHQPYPIYPTYQDIFDFVRFTLKKIVKMDTLRKIIHNKLSEKFKSCIGVSMEMTRLMASLLDLENNLEQLKNIINGLPIPFIFNLDEFGQQDFADAVEKVVIVPQNYNKATAQCPVNRNGKRSSCLACISPMGIFGKPQIAVSRSTIDSEIYSRLPKDCLQIVNTSNGYINTYSFRHWILTEFIPNLRELRQKYQYFGPSVLILDGYLSHKRALEDINFQNDNLIIHFIPPYTSDQIQPLDLGVFSIVRRFESNFRSNSQLSYQTNQIIKIQQTLSQAASIQNCIQAFHAAGVVICHTVVNGEVYQHIEFDVRCCSHIRSYQIPYIQGLIDNQKELTPNQQYIYQSYYNPENNQQNVRISLPVFKNLRNDT